jgi:hypothetical protein
VYLPLLLLALAIHRRPNTHELDAAAVEALLADQWAAARARVASLRAAAASAAPDVRLRSVEERLGWIEELRWQLRQMRPEVRCPSRALAEDSEGGDNLQRQQQQQQQLQQQQQQEQQEEEESVEGAAGSRIGGGDGGA